MTAVAPRATRDVQAKIGRIDSLDAVASTSSLLPFCGRRPNPRVANTIVEADPVFARAVAR